MGHKDIHIYKLQPFTFPTVYNCYREKVRAKTFEAFFGSLYKNEQKKITFKKIRFKTVNVNVDENSLSIPVLNTILHIFVHLLMGDFTNIDN